MRNSCLISWRYTVLRQCFTSGWFFRVIGNKNSCVVLYSGISTLIHCSLKLQTIKGKTYFQSQSPKPSVTARIASPPCNGPPYVEDGPLLLRRPYPAPKP